MGPEQFEFPLPHGWRVQILQYNPTLGSTLRAARAALSTFAGGRAPLWSEVRGSQEYDRRVQMGAAVPESRRITVVDMLVPGRDTQTVWERAYSYLAEGTIDALDPMGEVEREVFTLEALRRSTAAVTSCPVRITPNAYAHLHRAERDRSAEFLRDWARRFLLRGEAALALPLEDCGFLWFWMFQSPTDPILWIGTGSIDSDGIVRAELGIPDGAYPAVARAVLGGPRRLAA